MSQDFYGLPAASLSNDWLRLDYLTQAGPRIVRLALAGSAQNLLAEVPDLKFATPFGDLFLHGGHRLWHAPESAPRTYVPDNRGLSVEETPDGLRLCGPAEPATGIGKCIQIRLHASRPAVTVRHTLTNTGLWEVSLSPWAITQLPLGGIVVLPQRMPRLPTDPFSPNRQLVLWPLSRWSDARLHVHDDYVLVDAQPGAPPLKIGYLNRLGWAGYLRRGVFFCKRFAYIPGTAYPDLGSNVETYCERLFVELETLGPLVRLSPGASVEHTETWEVYAGLDAPETLEGVRALVTRLGLPE